MEAEAGPLRWYGQTFEGIAVPASGGDFSEEARLRLAPIGVYEIMFRQQPLYDFSGMLLCNVANPEPTGREGEWQFNAVEEVVGSERTLTIRTAEGALPFEALEVVPLDPEERPLDVTRVEVDARQSTIRYRNDAPPESQKIRFSGIDVFDVETVAARLWAGGQEFLSEPQATFLKRSDGIRIDRIGNPTGTARNIEGHLLALFEVLVDLEGSGTVYGFECRYQYPTTADGPIAVMPVMPPARRDIRNNTTFFSELDVELRNWYRSVEPAKGAFVIDVTLYDTNALGASPAVRLTQLLLPTESIADWE